MRTCAQQNTMVMKGTDLLASQIMELHCDQLRTSSGEMQLVPLLCASQQAPLLLQRLYRLGEQIWVGLLKQFVFKLQCKM